MDMIVTYDNRDPVTLKPGYDNRNVFATVKVTASTHVW